MTFRIKSFVFFCCLCCIVAAISLSGCKNNNYVKAEGLIWNTSYHLTYKGDPILADSAVMVLNEIGKSLNVFDTTSLIAKINLRDSVVTDRHFKKVYTTSRKVNARSKGMFDPTISPLITAWGFGPGHAPTQDTLEIERILDYVGISKTHLSGDTLIKDNPKISFNFSAVAKGYACDEVAAMFRRNGVNNFLIEIGGEIAVGGVSPSFSQWKISIDRPSFSDSAVVHDACAIIKVTDAGIATSGNYRNFRREGGSIFGHTISPLTGRPVVSDVISATVIAPSAMEADAAATACMAAGSVTAMDMIKSLGYECYLVLSDSTEQMTEGIKRILVTAADGAPGNKGRN